MSLGRFNSGKLHLPGLYVDKGIPTQAVYCYMINNIPYIIHTSSRVPRLLFFSFLKCDGVSPVIFLNWFERCETLL